MSGMDKELEAAYAAQQKRQKSLEDSKAELEAVSAQGQQLGAQSKIIGLMVVLMGSLVGAGILLYDPESRPWGFLLLFCVAVMGAFSWYRNWRKG
ncbi:MAG: hypothetical protein WC314_25905 [Vulcanimicrobiota bacterium]